MAHRSKRKGQGFISIDEIPKIIEVCRELGYTLHLGEMSSRNSQWVNIVRSGRDDCLTYFWNKVDGKTLEYCNPIHCGGGFDCEHFNPCRIKPSCCPSLAKRIFGCGCCCGCKR